VTRLDARPEVTPRADRTRAWPLIPAVAAAAVLVAAATAAGLWSGPLVVGIALTCFAASRHYRVGPAVACAGPAGLVGWAAFLLWRAIDGQPVAATARTAAALAGLPLPGWLVIAVTLLLATLQAVLGGWLGAALCALFRSIRAR
jgi:hypothetical protein